MSRQHHARHRAEDKRRDHHADRRDGHASIKDALTPPVSPHRRPQRVTHADRVGLLSVVEEE